MKKVVIGLSGGVDSSVSAKLLIDQGFEVIGVFMKNWDDREDDQCPAAVDALEARSVAQALNIPFYTVNFSKEYWEDVFEYFLQAHRELRTPSPDILCNEFIKFKAFLKHAELLGADFIATGHYARKVFNPETQLFELYIPKDKSKDQTYFLYAITQAALSKTLFPLENLEKSEVRSLARSFGFKNAEKKDSTGICFIGERDYKTFIQKYIPKNPGDIVTEKREKVGTHDGLPFYTLGQRKHLEIGGVKGYEELPWVVIGKNPTTNELIVGQNSDNRELFRSSLTASRLRWISGHPPTQSFRGLCRLRHQQPLQKIEITLQDSETLKVHFQDPQRAITPGQSIVLYDEKGEVCLGGGEIQ